MVGAGIFFYLGLDCGVHDFLLCIFNKVVVDDTTLDYGLFIYFLHMIYIDND